MKLLRNALLALALIATPAVSACASFGGVASVQTADEKALITAEVAYSFLLGTVTDMANAGALTADQARQIQPVLARADQAMRHARDLYDAGNAAQAALATNDAVAQVAALTALLQQLGVIHRVQS